MNPLNIIPKFSPTDEPVRVAGYGAAAVLLVLSVVSQVTGWVPASSLVATIQDIVAVLGPIVAAELARLKVMPVVNIPVPDTAPIVDVPIADPAPPAAGASEVVLPASPTA